jgi:hypothetical protein
MPDANRAQIGIVMMSPAHRFTGRDPQEWADEMLGRWSHVLIEHMELQVLAASLRTIEDWRDRRDRILASAVELSRSYREQSGDDETVALQALESRVSIIHPLIWFLTERGEVDDVLDVLGAWYEGRRANCDGDVLFVASGHMNGVEVILCAHSYGGCVISGAADAVPDRIAALVYLDAFLLEDGEALHDLLPKEHRELQLSLAAEYGDGWRVPPIPAEIFNVNARDRVWVDRQCTPVAEFPR